MWLPPSQLNLKAGQGSHFSSTAVHPHPVPPASTRGAELSQWLHFLPSPQQLESLLPIRGLGDSGASP